MASMRNVLSAAIGASALIALGAAMPAAETLAGVYKAGALTIEAPWARATPGGATVAGGYMRIVNGGSEPDRLVGGTLGAQAGEVHEMSTLDVEFDVRGIGASSHPQKQ